MEDKHQLECTVVFKINGKSNTPDILMRSIKVFLLDTVLPLLQELKTGNEELKVQMSIEFDKNN